MFPCIIHFFIPHFLLFPSLFFCLQPNNQQKPILAVLFPPPASPPVATNLPKRRGPADNKIVLVDDSVALSSSSSFSTTAATIKTDDEEEEEEEEEEEGKETSNEGINRKCNDEDEIVSGEITEDSELEETTTRSTMVTMTTKKAKGVGGSQPARIVGTRPIPGTESAAALQQMAAVPLGQCLTECLKNASSHRKVAAPSPSPSLPSSSLCQCQLNNQRNTTTTKMKKKLKIITTPEPFYYEYEAAPDITQFGPCNVSVITDQAQRIVTDLLFYAAATWVPFWAFLTIAVNMSFRQFGHHRWLDFYQEIGFIFLFPFMGIFVLKPQLDLLCMITTMVLLFWMVFILVIGFLQAYFSSSLVKGTSLKDGRLPVAVNYVWPIVIAGIPVGISIWLLRSDIGSNGIHCFVPIHSSLFWAFTLPACILWLLMLIRNQLSITACKQSRPMVDREQLYWAKKSVKGTPLLLCCFLLTFFTQLFAVDMQLLWLSVLFTLESLVLGPLIFLLHTHNHQRVNNGIFERTQMGFYRPCPIRRQLVAASASSAPPPPPPPPAAASGDNSPPSAAPPILSELPPMASSNIGTMPPIAPASAISIPKLPTATTIQLPPINQPIPSNIPSSTTLLKQQPHRQSILKRSHSEEKEKENNRANGKEGDGGEANAQIFYEWLTDSDERNLRESERVLWPPAPRPV